jgi:hypothetical protein
VWYSQKGILNAGSVIALAIAVTAAYVIRRANRPAIA